MNNKTYIKKRVLFIIMIVFFQFPSIIYANESHLFNSIVNSNVNHFILEYFSEITGIVLLIIILILSFAIKNLLGRLKAENEHKEALKNLEISLMELEAANKQLLASEEELNRQFLEIQKNEEEIKISKERYKLAVSGSEVGIWDFDFISHKIYMSKIGREIFGLPCLEQIKLKDITEKIVPADFKKVKKMFTDHIKGKEDSFQVKCRIKVSDGQYSWVSIRGRVLLDDFGNPIRMAGSVSNINKEKIDEARIKRLAYYDSLTGLRNKAYFHQVLKNYIEDEEVYNFGVLLLDLDNFKAINDYLGHSHGDEILKKISENLRSHIKSNQELIRFGGDEFIILVKNYQGEQQLIDYIESINKEFGALLEIDGIGFTITTSIGIARYPLDGNNADEILKHADVALNHVKLIGKNNYEIYSGELDQVMFKQLRVKTDLRQAIENQSFELYYQPKLDMTYKKLIGYEALIRWQHSEKGMIPPSDFIPVAEETGLIIPIGEWVLKTAIAQLKKWNDNIDPDLSVSINISASQFKDAYLVDSIKTIIETIQVNPNNIELEITETTALYDIQYAISVLKQIKTLGIKISLDDFGTGYSSLNYLTVLPIDYLKIDKSFIDHATKEKSKKEIIKSVINLAHACDLKVVAEGVETYEQFIFLRDEKCDIMQGYYFSKPVPSLEAIQVREQEIIL